MKHLTTFVVVTALSASACCKKTPPPVAPQPEPIAVVEPVAPAPDPEAEKAKAEAERVAKEKAEAEAKAAEDKRKQAEALAKAYAEFEADTAKEAARWTAELKKSATQLVSKAYPNPKAALTAILKSPVRVPGHADRDAHRHPLETLTFFGIKQNMAVIEMGAGEGWYTEILGAFLAKAGKFFVVSADPNGPADSGRTLYGKRTHAILAKSPELFGKAAPVVVNPPDSLSLGADGSVDMVLAVREMHNWHRRKMVAAYLKSIHNVLKPGGVLGVVAHRAVAGTNADDTAPKGYLPEQWLIETIEAAGFKLAAKSEINANPKDTKDYADGVWTLPPNYAAGETDKAKYTAIGESDRMTLRFVKVAAPAAK
ncbi:MAG: class I SAM-dependent methyltransferase [Myxococcales bacterium]|nr:class I SAM-dependent methyltransferase [Myxococcales bacterium]